MFVGWYTSRPRGRCQNGEKYFVGFAAVSASVRMGNMEADRITVDPDQCGGRPCVRGMRIRVSDVLDLLAAGLAFEEVVAELPDLELADVTACLRYASSRVSIAGAAA